MRGVLAALAALAAIGGAALMAGPALAAPAAPQFVALPDAGATRLTQARAYATATALPSGDVLIAGGYDGGFLSTTESFDVTGPTFAALPASIERAYAIAAPLPGGKVLLAGGYPTYQMQTAGIFDAGTNAVTPLPPSGQPTAARAGAVAAPLPGGKVLIAGGTPNFPPVGAVRSAELFDPATNTFTALPASGNTQLTVARRGAVAAPLPGGRVLIAGGTENLDDGTLLRSAELFDPATNTFTALPASGNTQLATARVTPVAAALPDGKVLIAGGWDGNATVLASAELFDPETNTFTSLPASGDTQLVTARRSAVAAVTANGKVLITGGGSASSGSFLRTAELFVPAPSGKSTGGDFGSQTVGQASAVRTITLKNLGAQSLLLDAGTPAVTSDSGAAGDFTLLGETCTGAALGYTETCTLDVRFTPSAPGTRTARVTLAGNEPGGATTVALTGTGVPVAPPAGPGTPAPSDPPAAAAGTPTPSAAQPVKAACRAKRSAKTRRTRVTCTVTGLAATSPRTARLSRRGVTVATGRLTAAGRLTITTRKRVRPGTYRLTIGATKLSVRVR